MSQRQEYFKGASPCSNCRKSNRFYIQDGLTYCKRCDFQQEVATQTEIPAEASQQIRQTTRKQKETVEKVSRSMLPYVQLCTAIVLTRVSKFTGVPTPENCTSRLSNSSFGNNVLHSSD